MNSLPLLEVDYDDVEDVDYYYYNYANHSNVLGNFLWACLLDKASIYNTKTLFVNLSLFNFSVLSLTSSSFLSNFI